MYILVHTPQPDENYSIDVAHMASLIDEKTAAILISNPSIPMGTIHSENDLRKVLALAEEHFIPLISDECEFPHWQGSLE